MRRRDFVSALGLSTAGAMLSGKASIAEACQAEITLSPAKTAAYKTWEAFDSMLDEQIETNRKGNLELTILDQLGNPLSGQQVTLTHTSHDFLFGVCPNGHISMSNDLANGQSKEAETYWKLIGELFNAATLWWGWRVLEPEKGKYTFDYEVDGYGPMETMIHRAERLGFKLTAHAILYPRPDVSPAWLKTTNGEDCLQRLKTHVVGVATRYKDRIAAWHPVNEAQPGLQKVYEMELNQGAVYKWIRDSAPNALLVVNGGNEIDPDLFQKPIADARRFGSDADFICSRNYHYLYVPSDLAVMQLRWNYYNQLVERYGKPLRYVEMGVNSKYYAADAQGWLNLYAGSLKVGLSSFLDPNSPNLPPINDETQAKFAAQMYKLVFAHPHMHEMTWWDIVDNRTWHGLEGGMVRKDFSRKLVFDVLKDLIHNRWNTQASLQTDGAGKVALRGFYGDYRVEISGNTYRANLTKKHPNDVVVALPGAPFKPAVALSGQLTRGLRS